MCGMRLVDRVSTDVLRDRVGIVVKIEDMIIQNLLWWYGHVMHGDINSQIREVMEVEITGKREKGRPRKSWEKCVKKDLERYGLRREDAYDREHWREQIRAKIANPASWDNGIETDVVVVVVVVVIGSIKKLFSIDFVNIHFLLIDFSIDSARWKKLTSNDCVNIFLFSMFFSIDFARWKIVGLPHFAYIVTH